MLPISRVVLVLACLVLASRASADDYSAAQRMHALDAVLGTKGTVPQVSAAATQAEIDAAYREFVRDRMSQDELYASLVRALIPGQPMFYPFRAFRFVLKTKRIGGRLAYYLGEPCRAAELVQVAPWWDKTTKVWVCKHSYTPSVDDDTSYPGTYCETPYNPDNPEFTPYVEALALKGTKCRCGAHLLNCARDGDDNGRSDSYAREEVVRTIQYVIQKRRPFTDILTMNETVRSPLADFPYQRAQFYRDGRFELALGDTPRLAPRDPQFGVGILTTPQIIWAQDSPRRRMWNYWNMFMCVRGRSVNVVPHQMFELPDSDLMYEQMALTQKVGCRNCHAAMENASLAFRGFSDVRHGLRAVTASPRTMKFFVRGHEDLRAEGPAEVKWLATQIAQQPEFYQCMVQRSTDMIFGGRPLSTSLQSKLVDDFKRDKDMWTLLESILLARLRGGS